MKMVDRPMAIKPAKQVQVDPWGTACAKLMQKIQRKGFKDALASETTNPSIGEDSPLLGKWAIMIGNLLGGTNNPIVESYERDPNSCEYCNDTAQILRTDDDGIAWSRTCEHCPQGLAVSKAEQRKLDARLAAREIRDRRRTRGVTRESDGFEHVGDSKAPLPNPRTMDWAEDD